MTRALLRSAALLCAALLAIAAAPVVAAQPAGTGAQLPDLEQEAPSGLEITVGGPRARRVYRLGFRSAVSNVGDGPLIIDGHRDGGSAAMVADQVLARGDGGQDVVPGVGKLTYVRSPDHDHWHLHAFDRYELRRAGRTRAVVRDRKSGFCLGDRYKTPQLLAAAAPEPQYRTRCGLYAPGLAAIREGISVGYGDAYAASIEYQDLPINGLPAGRYVLVHRVNADRRLSEISYANDASSMLLDLRWRAGVPAIRVLATCPDSARCDERTRARASAQRTLAHASALRMRPERFLCVLARHA
jgi:hypothetical protein